MTPAKHILVRSRFMLPMSRRLGLSTRIEDGYVFTCGDKIVEAGAYTRETGERIVEACGGSQQAFQMLLLEHLDKLAETSAQAISNIKFDKVIVWEGGGENGRGNTAGFLNGLAKTLPPMLQVMRDIGGVELPESLVKVAMERDKDGKGEDTTASAATAATGDVT